MKNKFLSLALLLSLTSISSSVLAMEPDSAELTENLLAPATSVAPGADPLAASAAPDASKDSDSEGDGLGVDATERTVMILPDAAAPLGRQASEAAAKEADADAAVDAIASALDGATLGEAAKEEEGPGEPGSLILSASASVEAAAAADVARMVVGVNDDSTDDGTKK